MPTKHHLFVVTHWLLKVAAIFSIFIMAALSVGLGALFVAATNLDGNHLGIPADIYGVSRVDALTLGGLALAGGLLSSILILFVIHAMTAIVQTAMSGDPFVNDNARRLTRIGWLLLALFAVEFTAKVTVDGLMKKLVDEHHVPIGTIGDATFGPDLSPIGLFTVLLIFVLAQIFRRGSEMRAELEGTV